MNIQFQTASSTNPERVSIQLLTYLNSKRLVYGLSTSINPALWDSENQRPIKSSKIPTEIKKQNPFIETTLSNIKRKLDTVEAEVQRILVTLPLLDKKIDKVNLKIELDNSVKIWGEKSECKSVKEENFFVSFFEEFYNDIKSGKRLIKNTKRRYKIGTINSYHGTLLQLKEFFGTRRIRFQELTPKVLNNFETYLSKEEYSLNTIGKHVKNIKVVMSEAYSLGMHENISYKEVSTKKEDSINIFLDQDEISSMEKLDYSDNIELDNIRDIFLMGCETALRYSDFSRISREHFHTIGDGVEVLKMRTTKDNRIEVTIPVSQRLKRLLIKHDFCAPNGIRRQDINKYIKEIAKAAGITKKVEVVKSAKGTTVIASVAKYKKVVTHTARRSGVTNMYLSGIEPLRLMDITGHKKLTTLRKYIKVDSIQTAKLISQNEFFSGRQNQMTVV